MSDVSPAAFEADLRAIREDRGLQIEDIQRHTRVPVDIIRRFEQGLLTKDADYSEVYLRAFIKTYAQAIDLSQQVAVQAYDATKGGRYRGELRQYLSTYVPAPEPSVPEPPPVFEPPASDAAVEAPPPVVLPPRPDTLRPMAPPPPPPPRPTPPPMASPPARPTPSPPRGRTATPPPAPRPAPVARPASPPRRTSALAGGGGDRSWGLVLSLAVGAVAVLMLVLYLVTRPPQEEVEPVAQQPTAPADSAQAASDDDTTPSDVAAPPRLADSIRVTLVAADGPIRGFRAIESRRRNGARDETRRPYWLEQGQTRSFASDSLVILFGTQSGSTYSIPAGTVLQFQGFEWRPTPGTVVRLDRTRAQAVLDSLHYARLGRGPNGQPLPSAPAATTSPATTAPAATPATRPATTPASRPATTPANRPTNPPAQRPATNPAPRPSTPTPAPSTTPSQTAPTPVTPAPTNPAPTEPATGGDGRTSPTEQTGDGR